jgi:hypothetical protein
MKLQDYIQYWDNEIKKWLSSPQEVAPQNKGVQCDYMPEPFMGNPKKHSFVIVNLNPGIGVCHSWFPLKSMQGTLINKVACSSYSEAVMDFPYLKDEESTKLSNWENNPGRLWWKSKEKWIKHILGICYPTENFNKNGIVNHLPFAMELFGWHSKSFLNSYITENYSNNKFKNCVIQPLIDAIRNSDFKFAFCVGKPIGDILVSYGDYRFISLPLGSPLKNGGFIVNAGNTSRNYRVMSDGKDHYIINTWVQGGNTFPAPSYNIIEKQIMSHIFQHNR